MDDLLAQLNSFDAAIRAEALRRLANAPSISSPETDWFNMHLHTFFSFNGEGHSPTRLAWEAKQRGLYAIAICDFDVLTGLDELLVAGDLLGLRAAVGFESRTFFAEYADQEINSPGEPGVFYFMGMGFVRQPAIESPAGAFFADMLARSHQRNRDLIDRINAQLEGLDVDYDADVLPLTPSGNATERHLVQAYHEKALSQAGRCGEAAGWWARRLGLDTAVTSAAISDTNAFCDLLRSKLIKRGGLGYTQPTEATFPHLDRVIEMILACEAIPMSAWLDGTSAGESDPEAQLECLMSKGVAAVNIVPDRNWNIKDPQERERKVAEFHRYATIADNFDLPINVGTELNKPGQRLVDDFSAEAMKPLHSLFLRGAQVMVGHTRLLKYASFSYTGERAAAEFSQRAKRNDFFAAVGALPHPGAEVRATLAALAPDQAYARIHDAVRAGHWCE